MTIREGVQWRAEQAFADTKLAVGISGVAAAVVIVDVRNRVNEIVDRIGEALSIREPTLADRQANAIIQRTGESEQLQELAKAYIPNEIAVGQSWIDAADADVARYVKASAAKRTPNGANEQELEALRNTANNAPSLRDHGILISGKAIYKGFLPNPESKIPCETTADDLYRFKQQLLSVHPELWSLSVEQAHKLLGKMGFMDDIIATLDRFGVTPLPHPEEVM